MNGKGADKVAIKRMIVDKMAIREEIGADKVPTNAEIGDKMAIRDSIIDKMADIVLYLESAPK